MTQESFSDPARLAQQLLAAANSMSDAEASKRYQQILGQLPREEAAQLNALALTQVAPDQRRVLASGLKQAHQDPSSAFDGYDDDDDEVAATPQRLGQLSARAAQQDPARVNSLLGGDNSGLGGQIGKAALAALAAMLLRQFMSGQGQQAPGGAATGAPAGADPVSMILGGLLGGAAGGGGMPQQAGGAGDMGSILGGLLGGAAGGGGMPQQAGGAGDLGSILGGLLGGAAGGGGMPQQAGGAGDLGSILGGLLGGAAGGGGMPQQAGGAGAPDLGSILGSILGGGGGGPSHRKD